jgi:hypothetical protein
MRSDYAATGSEFDKSLDGLLAEAAHEQVASCTRKPSGGDAIEKSSLIIS